MKLSPENINQFNDEGYLFFPELFSKKEIAKLQNEVPKILTRTGPEIIREKKDNKVARLAFGVHSYSDPYNRMMLHPRMLEPVKQLLNDDVIDLEPDFQRMVVWSERLQRKLIYSLSDSIFSSCNSFKYNFYIGLLNWSTSS